MFDASGSIIIGLGLAKVAYFLVSSNMTYLVGQSIPHETIYEIQNELEDRDTVRAVYDVKATYLGLGFFYFSEKLIFLKTLTFRKIENPL